MSKKIKILIMTLVICIFTYCIPFYTFYGSILAVVKVPLAATKANLSPVSTVTSTDITSREQLEKLLLNAYIKGSKKVSFRINNSFADKINPELLVSDVLQKENGEYKYFKSYSILRDNKNNYSITFLSSYSQQSIADMNIKVLAKVKQIVKSIIKPSMNDYQKELALHEYLLKNIKYDYSNYRKSKIPDLDYTPYGALIRKVAVCQGYSEAMNLLLKEVNIQSIIVSGTAKGVNHAWNMVKIEGEWYQLDSTFNHPFMNGIQVISHNYFNITDTQLAKDHSWNRRNYPQCTKTKFAYRDDIEKVDKTLVKSINEINNLLKNESQVSKKAISFKIFNKNFKNFDVHKLIQDFNKNNINQKYIALLDNFSYKDSGSVTSYNIVLEYKGIDILFSNLNEYRNYLADMDNSNVGSISIATIGLNQSDIEDSNLLGSWKYSFTNYMDIGLILIDLKNLR